MGRRSADRGQSGEETTPYPFYSYSTVRSASARAIFHIGQYGVRPGSNCSALFLADDPFAELLKR